MGRRHEPLGDAGKLHARGVREAHPRAVGREGALQREDVREGGGDQASGGRVRCIQQAAARGGGELAPAGVADVVRGVAVQVAHEEGELVHVQLQQVHLPRRAPTTPTAAAAAAAAAAATAAAAASERRPLEQRVVHAAQREERARHLEREAEECAVLRHGRGIDHKVERRRHLHMHMHMHMHMQM
eukprot:scaffold80044_cov65-Phaeocystis_antarctica.AAC.2